MKKLLSVVIIFITSLIPCLKIQNQNIEVMADRDPGRRCLLRIGQDKEMIINLSPDYSYRLMNIEKLLTWIKPLMPGALLGLYEMNCFTCSMDH